MKIITNSLLWFINTVSCVLLLLLLTGTVIWLVAGREARHTKRQIEQAQVLLKEKVKVEASAVFSGCVYPENGIIIVAVNKSIFFGVKGNEVFIPRLTAWYNDQAKAMAPGLPLREENLDLYYLMEYCR